MAPKSSGKTKGKATDRAAHDRELLAELEETLKESREFADGVAFRIRHVAERLAAGPEEDARR